MDKGSRDASIRKHLATCRKAPPEATAKGNLHAKARLCDPVQARRGNHSPTWGMVMTRRLANGDKARELAKVAERRGHLVRHVLRCGPQRARVFFTCVHCLHVSRTVSALGRLKGSCGGAGERERALRTTGKQKLYVGVGVQGRRVLKRFWGLSDKEHACLMVNARRLSTAAPLKQWLRDVTEEGIEPHPGPSSSASSHLPGTYMYLNVGGCTNAFAALDLVQALDDQPAVWGLAEVRASPNEQAALTRRASQMGFRTWWISSTRGARQHGMPNWKGGLCVGVHEDICRLRRVSSSCSTSGASSSWWHGAVLTVQGTPLTPKALWAGHATASGHPFLAFGDWNDEPHESPFTELGYRFFVPADQGQMIPSRWRGSRPIDWACTNDPCAVFVEPRISDHECLWLTGSFAFERTGHFVFSPTCHLDKPEDVTLTAWREAVAAYFEDAQVQWADDVDVQWTQLTALLELSLRHALESFQDRLGNASHGSARRDLRPKGSLAAVVPASRPDGGRRHAVPEGALLQRLAAFLGRLHEATRVQGRPLAATRTLMDKIAATWPAELTALTLEEAIPECEAWIQRLRQASTRGVQRWRKEDGTLLGG